MKMTYSESLDMRTEPGLAHSRRSFVMTDNILSTEHISGVTLTICIWGNDVPLYLAKCLEYISLLHDEMHCVHTVTTKLPVWNSAHYMRLLVQTMCVSIGLETVSTYWFR